MTFMMANTHLCTYVCVFYVVYICKWSEDDLGCCQLVNGKWQQRCHILNWKCLSKYSFQLLCISHIICILRWQAACKLRYENFPTPDKIHNIAFSGIIYHGYCTEIIHEQIKNKHFIATQFAFFMANFKWKRSKAKPNESQTQIKSVNNIDNLWPHQQRNQSAIRQQGDGAAPATSTDKRSNGSKTHLPS